MKKTHAPTHMLHKQVFTWPFRHVIPVHNYLPNRAQHCPLPNNKHRERKEKTAQLTRATFSSVRGRKPPTRATTTKATLPAYSVQRGSARLHDLCLPRGAAGAGHTRTHTSVASGEGDGEKPTVGGSVSGMPAAVGLGVRATGAGVTGMTGDGVGSTTGSGESVATP